MSSMRPYGPWPLRRPKPEAIRLLTAAELRSWIVHEDEDVIVVNKSGDLVCHPSKSGPWSSLVGAVRELTGLDRVHLVFRLDRETSGVVVLAKNPATASRLQRAMQERRVRKAYLALLTGELAAETVVDQPLGPDEASLVHVKDCVRPDGRTAASRFVPLQTGGGYTLAGVRIETGRKHQIRVHAHWLGYPVVGDKIYGPDPQLYLDFIDQGWTAELATRLLLPRQALHCAVIDLTPAGLPWTFRAPWPADLADFAARHLGEAAAARAAGWD